MRKLLTLLLCLMALASVFISCNAEQQGSDLATVRLSIDSERSRTINVDGNLVAKYRFDLIQKDVTEYSFSFDKSEGGVYTMTGIKPGTYTLACYALNAEEKVVSKIIQESKKLTRGANSFTVSFSSYHSEETGKINFTVKWTPGDYGTTKVNITGTVKPLTGVAKTIDFPVTGDTNNGNIEASVSNLPIGSYLVSIVGKAGSKSVFGINEVIVISPGIELKVEYNFTGSAATSSITVVDNLVKPFTGTLTASNGSKFPEINLNLSINQITLPESIYKDESGNIKNITIDWYVEDYKYKTTTVQYNPNGPTTTSVTMGAIYGSAYYSAVFYIDGVNDSLGSEKITINYDASTGTIVQ